MEEEHETIIIQVNSTDWDQQTVADFEHLPITNLTSVECGIVKQEVSNVDEVVTVETYPTEHDKDQENLEDKPNSEVDEKSMVPSMKYECPYCGVRPKTKNALYIHIRTHAAGEKPLKCDFCGNTFRTKAEMDRHIKQHYQKKEYFCGMCGAEFVTGYSCAKHMKNIHKVKNNDINMFRLKEELSETGEDLLFIKVIRNGEAYGRRFKFVKEL